MMRFLCVMLGALFLHAARARAAEAPAEAAPTHAEAAVVLAKYSGLFDSYVAPDATPGQCVRFLNERGVRFGLLEVVSGAEFTSSDAARVFGQIELLLSGEATFSHGIVKLPKHVDSWEDFCIMQGVEFAKGYKQIMDGARRLRRIRD